MTAAKIKKEIGSLSFEEIIDIAAYVNEVIVKQEPNWVNDLSISEEEKKILDERFERIKAGEVTLYTLEELKSNLQEIRFQRETEKDLSISLSGEEKKELDRRYDLVKNGKTERVEFRKGFKNLHAWANTK